MHRNNAGNLRNEFLDIIFGRSAQLKSALLGDLISAAAPAVDDFSKFETPVVETAAGVACSSAGEED
jgi:hypothetical protein